MFTVGRCGDVLVPGGGTPAPDGIAPGNIVVGVRTSTGGRTAGFSFFLCSSPPGHSLRKPA